MMNCNVHNIQEQYVTEKNKSKKKKKTPWSVSMSELYQPSDRRLSAKLVPTFADRGCHMVSVMDQNVNTKQDNEHIPQCMNNKQAAKT
jgi:hypothetical protein